MIPVVTPEEMKEIDAAAPEPVEMLIERAGAAVARAAVRLLGGTYGRRVVVVAGKGNNGADGRAAASRLARRGARVTVVDAADAPRALPHSDLVVDAAYGTGFRGEYQAPDPGGAPVLAVDIPSGVDGLTGEAGPGAVNASATVTFAALKPGLLFGEGPARAGAVEVADIGLDVSGAVAHVVEPPDVGGWLPARPRGAHKYHAAVWVVAGSPGMMGAASLCAQAAMRAGAGYVRLGVPGADPVALPVGEHVARALPNTGWDTEVLADLDRFKAIVIGPGLGRAAVTVAAVRRLVAASPVPVVVDGDGLHALGDFDTAVRVIGARGRTVVLTPHDGEYTALAGEPPGPDRAGAAFDLAVDLRATVLLKGPTTVVADPGGRLLLSAAGDVRLATAGTGDVLAGIVAAFLADGMPAPRAAAAGAVVHGAAGHLGFARGLVAGDLPGLLPSVLSALVPENR